MVRAIAAAAALLLLILPARAGLDFTPHFTSYEVEGMRVPNLTFHDHGETVFYTPPSNWHPSGRGKFLTLIPPRTVQAGASFEAVPAGPTPLAAVTDKVDDFVARALELLPPEVSKVEVVTAGVSELLISGLPGVEVLLHYTSFAQRFTMSVLFIPLGEELIRLRFTAHTADFAPLARIFRRSLYSLQGLKPHSPQRAE